MDHFTADIFVPDEGCVLCQLPAESRSFDVWTQPLSKAPITANIAKHTTFTGSLNAISFQNTKLAIITYTTGFHFAIQIGSLIMKQ